MAVWLITGCSSGLGRGIAQAALERGENVTLTARIRGRWRSWQQRTRSKRLRCGST